MLLTSCGQPAVSPTPNLDERIQRTALLNVNLVPMTEEVVLENQTVLVEGTRIIQIGPSHEVAIPGNAVVINGAGAYLMPGLADMHIHTRDDWLSDEWPVSPLNLFLASGVTTVRDFGPGGESLTYALRWWEKIKEGKLDGPTIYTSGKILYASPVDDPTGCVQWNHAQGFDFQKLYSYLSKEDFHEAMAAAKELGFYTAGHIPYPVGLDGVLAEGMDEIAHVEELDFEFIDFDRSKRLQHEEWLPYVVGTAIEQHSAYFGPDVEGVEERYGEDISLVVDKLQPTGVPLCTTLVVDDLIVQKLFEPEAFLARLENKYLPQRYIDAFLQGEEKHQRQFEGIEDLAPFKYALDRALLRALKRAEIPLVLGTDAGGGGMGIVPGFSIHDELRILVENGFTPYETIATGTVDAARVVEAMTGEGNFGTIEVGNRADLILVTGNPLEDVANIRDPLRHGRREVVFEGNTGADDSY